MGEKFPEEETGSEGVDKPGGVDPESVLPEVTAEIGCVECFICGKEKEIVYWNSKAQPHCTDCVTKSPADEHSEKARPPYTPRERFYVEVEFGKRTKEKRWGTISTPAMTKEAAKNYAIAQGSLYAYKATKYRIIKETSTFEIVEEGNL